MLPRDADSCCPRAGNFKDSVGIGQAGCLRYRPTPNSSSRQAGRLRDKLTPDFQLLTSRRGGRNSLSAEAEISAFALTLRAAFLFQRGKQITMRYTIARAGI